MKNTTAPSRRRALGFVFAIALLGLVGGAWLAGSAMRSPAQAAAGAKPPEPSVITADVELRVLATTVIARGDVAAATTFAVGIPSSASAATVTAVAVSVGDEIGAGEWVIEVAGRPVFVFEGAVPAYREMRPGSSGVDVRQLQNGLVSIGCAPETDGVFGPATKVCLTGLYHALGYEPVPSSPTADADLSAARSGAADAQATLDAAEATLAVAVGGPSGSSILEAKTAADTARRHLDDARAQRSTAIARVQNDLTLARAERDRLSVDPAAPQAELDAAATAVANAELTLADVQRESDTAIADARATVDVAVARYSEIVAPSSTSSESNAVDRAVSERDVAQATLAELQWKSGPIVPLGEIAFVPQLPAMVESSVALGQFTSSTTTSGAPPSLMRLTTGSLLVNSRLGLPDRKLVDVGMHVVLNDETSGSTYDAELTSVEVSPTVGADGLQGFPNVITPTQPLPRSLAGANVRVTFTTAATKAPVLVVPLAAVSAGADGQARLDKVTSDGVRLEVLVTSGLSADGFIEVRPIQAGALRPNDKVVVG